MYGNKSLISFIAFLPVGKFQILILFLNSHSRMLSHKGREAGYSGCGSALKLERNNCPFLWWVLPLRVAEARTNFKLGSIFFSHKKSAA
jgi:hypothetical protein